MLNFNSNGYLEPFEALEIDFEGTQRLLVWNEHRAHIWANFEVFIADLRIILASSFSVWLNGSFATQKANPNDLDCVIFVDFEVYDTLETKLQVFKSLQYKKENYLDIYFVKTYPKEHKKKFFEDIDTKEWFFLFTKTRKKNINKGFLQLNF